jgi:hypothetical protein
MISLLTKQTFHFSKCTAIVVTYYLNFLYLSELLISAKGINFYFYHFS